MKTRHLTILLSIFLIFTASYSFSETISIGLGEMDVKEFNSLKQIMAGNHIDKSSVTNTEHPVKYGELSMLPSEYNALKQMVAGTSSGFETASVSTEKTTLVDIGTGSMSKTEFCTLVAMANDRESGNFNYICTVQ